MFILSSFFFSLFFYLSLLSSFLPFSFLYPITLLIGIFFYSLRLNYSSPLLSLLNLFPLFLVFISLFLHASFPYIHFRSLLFTILLVLSHTFLCSSFFSFVFLHFLLYSSIPSCHASIILYSRIFTRSRFTLSHRRQTFELCHLFLLAFVYICMSLTS